MRKTHLTAALIGALLVAGLLLSGIWRQSPSPAQSLPAKGADENRSVSGDLQRNHPEPNTASQPPSRLTLQDKRLSAPPPNRDDLKSLLVQTADTWPQPETLDKVDLVAEQMARLVPAGESVQLFVLALQHPAAQVRTAAVDNLARHRNHQIIAQISRETAGRRSAELETALGELHKRLETKPPG